jgi:Protein of unknown function (DUF3999)
MRREVQAAWFAVLSLGALSPQAGSQGAAAPGISSLEFQREVQLAPGAAQQYIVIDGKVWEHARADLGDLRLYAAGAEVPYVAEAAAGARLREEVECKVLQPVTVARKTQFILDMTQAEVYSGVHLELNSKDFVSRARIEGANEVHAKDWALLGSSTLYDFTSEGLGHNSTLEMPDATFRYLRVTLDGPVKRDEVLGAKTRIGRGEAARWVTVAERPTIAQQGRDTVLSFSLPARVPVERIHFDIDGAQPNFVRLVEVESVATSEAKEKTERLAGNGTITKIHLLRGGKKIDEEDFDVSIFAPGPGTLKIIVHNGDDAPLHIAGAQLEQLERRVYFETPAASPTTMYYGNERLGAPNYDYGKFFQVDSAAAESRLLAEEMNAAYRKPADPRPWSERHPAAMWAALVATIVVLGGVAVRSLRSATT